MLQQHRNLGFPFLKKNVLFKLEDLCFFIACPSHIHTHTFQTSTIALVVTATLLHCSPLRYSFLQRSQFTEESGKLCNDVLEVSVMDGCYCLLMLVTSVHYGAGCCTMLFLILCNFFYCLVYRTVRDLVQHGISYSAGSTQS